MEDSEVILRGKDGSLLHYGLGTAARVSARETRDSFMLTEVGWFLINTGRPVPASRSDFLAVLADIEAMYVRASVSRGMMSSRLWKVTLDISVAQMTGGPPASDIEECLCPPQYSGTSCESCHQVSKQTKYFHLLKYFHFLVVRATREMRRAGLVLSPGLSHLPRSLEISRDILDLVRTDIAPRPPTITTDIRTQGKDILDPIRTLQLGDRRR